MPAAYRQFTPATIDAFLAQLDADLIGANSGATRTTLNAAAGAPGVNARIRAERIYQMNGTVLQPARSYLDINRQLDDGGNHRIEAISATAMKGPFAVTNIARSGGSLITITAPGHNLVVGDLPLVNGTVDESFHGGNGFPNAQNLVTAIVAGVSFSYQDPRGGGAVASEPSGGTCAALYNLAGGRTVNNGQGAQVILADGPMSAFYAYDEFRVAGLILQGGLYKPFYWGQTGRDHIAASLSDTAFTIGAIASPQVGAVINLDRASPNLKIGQTIWVVDSASGTVELTTIAAKASNTQITCTLAGTPPGGSYASGALVGWDPCPTGVLSGTAGNANLNTLTFYASHELDGTRSATDMQANGFVTHADMNTNFLDQYTTDAQIAQLRDIMFLRGNAPSGIRGRAVGWSVYPMPGAGGPSDQDLIRVGGTTDLTVASDPPFDYKIFTGQQVGDNGGGGNGTRLCVGPNALP